ncbi:MAG: N-acetyltransferase [Arsenicicoccus sp.]|nr:MAG: N-acetyltransferase [Arsenicicoccus sp.]
MPSDLLSITFPAAGEPPSTDPAGHLTPLDRSQREDLSRLYLASYPPQVGAADLDDARREIDETFTGQFGTLRFDASWLAHACGRPAGAILVVERSIWDDHLDGPFVIDLFVHPEARGLGLGRSLGLAAMKSCSSAGDRQLSLRVGDGTSATAHGLYGRLGFVELT